MQRRSKTAGLICSEVVVERCSRSSVCRSAPQCTVVRIVRILRLESLVCIVCIVCPPQSMQALDSVAEYTLRTTAEGPSTLNHAGCTRMQRYCPTIFKQFASYVSSGASSSLAHSAHMLPPLMAAASVVLLLGGTTARRYN